MISVSNTTLLTRSLVEINAVDSGGTPQAELLSLALETENAILDQWNADRGMVYADQFLPFTIIPNQNPTTIGPAANWAMTERPVSVEGIQVLLTGSPVPYVYLTPRDARWWQQLPAPTVTAPFPTDFFFNPTWTAGVGAIYLWPVPTTAYAVQLWCRTQLASLTAASTVSLPPAYNRGLMLSVARALAPVLRKPWTSAQEADWAQSMRTIENVNTVIPRIRTAGIGLSNGGGGGSLPTFFWPSGLQR